MEGDRILRDLRGDRAPNLLNDVQSYLSHVGKNTAKALDVSALLKYHTFSLKLLRCCIERFEESRSDPKNLLKSCKIATEKLEEISLQLSKSKIQECHLDRLIKLLYHVLLHLHKCKDIEEFIWFSEKISSVFNTEPNQANLKDAPERNKIFTKIFEMHWSLAKTVTTKPFADSDDEIFIQLNGCLFILECHKNFPQFGKYFENCIIKFTVENRNKKLLISTRTSLKVAALMKAIYHKMLHHKKLESSTNKNSFFYHLCLLYKFVILFIKSEEVLESSMEMLSAYSNCPIWTNFYHAINEAYKAKIILCKFTSNKRRKEFCKQAMSFRHPFSVLSTICKEMFYPELLRMNPKLIIICDIVKALVNMKQALCGSILICVCKFSIKAGTFINSTQENMLTELENVDGLPTADSSRGSICLLCTQWFSYVSWLLQAILSSLLKNESKQEGQYCSCLSRLSVTRQDLLGYCVNFFKYALKTLSLLSKTNPDFTSTEYRWLGLLSYNFGRKAQEEQCSLDAASFYDIAIQALKIWVQYDSRHQNENDVFSKMQQINLSMKHKVLVDMLVEVSDFKAAQSSIREFVEFLFTALISTDQHNYEYEIRKEIELWIAVLETAKSRGKLKETISMQRIISRLMGNVDERNLKLIMETEFTMFKLKGYNDEMEDLLTYMTEKFGEEDLIFISKAQLQYASSSCTGISPSRRLELCRTAIKNLEHSLTRTADFQARNMLALAYFHMGYYQHKFTIADYTKSAEKKQTNPTEFFHYFNSAVDIWTLMLQDSLLRNRKAELLDVLESGDEIADYLYHIGFIYSLHYQRLNAVHAFHLSALLREMNEHTSKNEDPLAMRITANGEMICLLANLYDLNAAVTILDKLQMIDIDHGYKCIQFAISKATILNKAGRCLEAEKILKEVLCHRTFSLKTTRTHLMKSDVLLALAFSQEFARDSYQIEDHPIVIALEALKISRCLFKLFFEPGHEISGDGDIFPNFSLQKTSGQPVLSPWGVLDRLLSCLLYVAQRYRYQGNVREATFHLNEGLMLCEKYLLIDRKLEFLMEEAEICLITHEFDKALSKFDNISSVLNGKCIDNTIKDIDFLQSFQHEADCACEFCSEIFLNKFTIQCMILSQKLSSICPKTTVKFSDVTSVRHALQYAIDKTANAFKDLRGVLYLVDPEAKAISTHMGLIDKSNQNIHNMDNNFGDFQASDLGSTEAAHLCYCNETITLNSLQKNVIFKKDHEKLSASSILTCFKEHVENLEFRKITTHNCRRAFAMLYYEVILFALNCKEGCDLIELHWRLNRNLNSQTVNECSTQKDVKKLKNTAMRSKRNATRRRAANKHTAKGSIEEDQRSKVNVCAEMDAQNINDECIIESIAVQIQQLCFEALSFLVPYLDCLLVKKFYRILSLVIGYKDIEVTNCIEQLTYARTLQQQIFTQAAKNIRNSRKEENKMAESPMIKSSKKSLNPFESQSILNAFTFTNRALAFQNHLNFNECIIDSMPEGWRICSMRILFGEKKYLIISRSQANRKPILLRIPICCNNEEEISEDLSMDSLVRDLASAFEVDPIEEINQVLEDSRQCLETDDVKSWWQDRKRLDRKLQRIMSRIENQWLGCWKGILLGTRVQHVDEDWLERCANEFCHAFLSRYNIQLSTDYVTILLDSHLTIDRAQVKKAFTNILGDKFDETMLQLFLEKAEEFEKNLSVTSKLTRLSGRGRTKKAQHDAHVEAVKRSPVILILDKHLQKIPWETLSILRNQMISRMPSIIFTQLTLHTSKSILTNGVDIQKAFYILNPRRDLANTQKTFENWFQNKQGWSGIVGKIPTQQQYKDALQHFDMFIYCGHGNGREFLPGDDVQRIHCRAASFLMGCSSGRLQVKGELEAQGMALHYLVAGCPAIVANLWDVTDKDIDRFLAELLKRWLEQAPNTSLSSHMTDARNACFLPYLVGASPVIYGLPVILNYKDVEDTQSIVKINFQ